LGKYDEAEAMLRRALVGRGKALGAEHPDTLASVNHLGNVLERQGEYDNAKMVHTGECVWMLSPKYLLIPY
jgi:hypothetical protein